MVLRCTVSKVYRKYIDHPGTKTVIVLIFALKNGISSIADFDTSCESLCPLVFKFSGGTMRFLLVISLLAACAACAKSPESISPAYVSHLNYQNWNCYQLADEGQRLSSALAQASVQQENARTNDTVGVILLGLPVSSLSGDNIAPEIARLKGESEAVRKASLGKACQTASIAPSQQ